MYDAQEHVGPFFELSPGQAALRADARKLAETVAAPQAASTDRTEEYPRAVVDALTAAGFMGQTVPAALGGPGRSYFDTALVIEELARVCGVSGRIVVEGNMGAVGAIIAYGSPEQRRIAAEHVLSGDKPAICITEPGAGSAATEMTSTARREGD
ncbi:MAG: acyl-CoA dehydrogenase family protein, partial [Pseudomonadota bacterium]